MAGSFFDGLLDSVQNPLFLGGVGLMSGGAPGMTQGLAAGNQFAQQKRKRTQDEAMQNGLMAMQGLSDQDKQILGASPELAADVLGKMYSQKFDPNAGLDKRYKEAQIRKLEREPTGGEQPSNVREYQYFQSLGPEQQQRYLTMKRADRYYNAGTEFVQPDPMNPGANRNSIPIDVSGKASMAAQGKAQGEAVAELPKTLEAAEIALKTVQQIREHPGKQYGVGAIGGTLPGVPGTSQRGFVNLVNQAKGQTFLQAYQMLKGGGNIANAEGAKAEAAMARLDRAQSDADFDMALNDLEGIIRSGMTRARAKAGNGPAMNAPANAAPLPDPLGIR